MKYLFFIGCIFAGLSFYFTYNAILDDRVVIFYLITLSLNFMFVGVSISNILFNLFNLKTNNEISETQDKHISLLRNTIDTLTDNLFDKNMENKKLLDKINTMCK